MIFFSDEMILILLLEIRRYIYSKVLIIFDVSIQLTSESRGAQCRSGRASDSVWRGPWFDPQWWHSALSLSKTY